MASISCEFCVLNFSILFLMINILLRVKTAVFEQKQIDVTMDLACQEGCLSPYCSNFVLVLFP